MTESNSRRAAMDRRAMLLGSASLGAIAAIAVQARSDSAWAQDAPTADAVKPAGTPFPVDHVRKLAESLARSEYAAPTAEVPEPFKKLSAEQFRDIRFMTDKAVWRADRLDFELQLLPMGWLYDKPVEIWLVDGGEARQLKADGSLFQFGKQLEGAPPEAPFGFSGFRIHGPLNRSDLNDEYVVFQGASYFRAMARNQAYGLSARGLALNTAQPSGEEVPSFRALYIEKPKPGAPEIIVHALLDSPSVTGAYRFVIQPGDATVMDIDATLFPRRALTHVGLAPLTSMFLHGSAHHRVNNDFRPAVHDSEGLAVLNGKGERLWRPLTNPKTLQISAFMDKNPKGFGLAQRDRKFSSYEDLEARYERRPTAWVEPKGGWGDGYVELIEIPTEVEIHDNIVVYWKPAKALESGVAHRFVYRLHWTENIPASWSGAWVDKTFVGGMKQADTQLFVVDFEGPSVRELRELPVAQLGVSAGAVANLSVQRHPDINGVRVTFELNTAGTEVAELRLSLKAGDKLISETWLFRWTRA
jgi:glucans biosynthesis protein